MPQASPPSRPARSSGASTAPAPPSRGLSGAAVGKLLTRAAARASVEEVTGHSACAGRRAGKDRNTIAAFADYTDNSASLNGYMQRADRWDEPENAQIGIAGVRGRQPRPVRSSQMGT